MKEEYIDIGKDGGYGGIGNLSKRIILEWLNDEDEEIYRKYLQEQDSIKYKCFEDEENNLKG